MAEAVAPRQAEPSFLERIGGFLTEKGILARPIPLDDGTRPVQGAIAPAPALTVEAAPVARSVLAPASIPAINSGISEKDRAAAEAAKANGSSKALLQAAALSDSPEAQRALAMRAANAEKGDANFAATLGKVEEKGGLQSPDGRMAYAQLWQNKDNAPQYANAFIQYALGNTKAAKSYLSGGLVTDQIKIDTNTGHAIKYGVDENGDYHWAIDQTTGKQLLPEEFNKVVGTLGTLEQSIVYQQQKDNAKEWTARFNTDVDNAVTTGAAAQTLGGAYKAMGEAITGLKDIDPALASDLSKFASSTIGTSASQSKAAQAFKQRVDSSSLKAGETVSAELAAGLSAGLPANLVGATFKGNGIFQTTSGNTIDINALASNMATANTNAEMEKKFNANAKDLLSDAKIQALMAQDPSGALVRKYKAAIDLAQSIAMQEAKVGSNAFNLPTIAFGVTDDFARARIQAEQGMFNQKANEAYAAYALKMAKTFGPGKAPRPGELVAGFTASNEYKSLLSEYKNSANRILKETPEFAPKPAGVGVSQEAASVPSVAAPTALVSAFPVSPDAMAKPAAKPAGSAAPPAAGQSDAEKRAAAVKAAREAAKR
jgi:hypothetical protein